MEKLTENIDRIKNIMFGEDWKKLDDIEDEPIEIEMSEDEAAATTTTSSGGGASSGYPTVTKWETGVARGKANPIANNKWETGLTRGKANTLI